MTDSSMGRSWALATPQSSRGRCSGSWDSGHPERRAIGPESRGPRLRCAPLKLNGSQIRMQTSPLRHSRHLPLYRRTLARTLVPALFLLVGCDVGIDREVSDAAAPADARAGVDSGAPPRDVGVAGTSEDGGAPPGSEDSADAGAADARVDGGAPSDSDASRGAGELADAGPDAGGSASPAKPSAGCGKAGRPSGGTVTVANDHIYTFPTSYDGTKPFPLLMGFHAASNPIDQIRTLTNGSDFEKNYVRAFGKSKGSAWDYNTDRSKVLAIYDELMASYCIDMGRVFATGHSSGAQMIVQILTKSADATHFNFKAVAPVAASNYGAIVGPIPVMYIQGSKDTVRNSSGADVVARFTKVNGCTTTTMPYAEVDSCMSGGASVNPGCVDYQGCTQRTLWCSHNDSAYSGTSHGWPCFATRAMYDFFTALP
jgi:polyhydroxybutyrate depolymerase